MASTTLKKISAIVKRERKKILKKTGKDKLTKNEINALRRKAAKQVAGKKTIKKKTVKKKAVKKRIIKKKAIKKKITKKRMVKKTMPKKIKKRYVKKNIRKKVKRSKKRTMKRINKKDITSTLIGGAMAGAGAVGGNFIVQSAAKLMNMNTDQQKNILGIALSIASAVFLPGLVGKKNAEPLVYGMFALTTTRLASTALNRNVVAWNGDEEYLNLGQDYLQLESPIDLAAPMDLAADYSVEDDEIYDEY